MTKVSDKSGAAPSTDKIEVTPQMIEAGKSRLQWLLHAGTSSDYMAEEVYRAMEAVRRSDGDPV